MSPQEIAAGLSAEERHVIGERHWSPSLRRLMVSCPERSHEWQSLLRMSLVEHFSSTRYYEASGPRLMASGFLTPLGRAVAEALTEVKS